MILTFTDFGAAGPYTGQMKAVLAQSAPGVPVIDLLADAPACDPRAGAYLLAALAPAFPPGAVFLAVIDPGVGGARAPLIVEASGRVFVGPDNGLFEIAARRAGGARRWRIDWRPERMSASFHGRDLFAAVAARLARGDRPAAIPATPLVPAMGRPGAGWPDDLAEIVYIDGYGNAMTGLRAGGLAEDAVLTAGGRPLHRMTTFEDAPPGAAFWYENANGLAEIAVNRGRADDLLDLAVGTSVGVGDSTNAQYD